MSRQAQATGVGGEIAGSAQPVAAADRPVDSRTLMQGKRELIICHGAETYRLRITASNKLILTK